MPIYADWNATTPLSAVARAAMLAASEEAWANPSSVHTAGRKARAVVEAARVAAAKLAGFDARDVVLTSGGTEANNLALTSLVLDADSNPTGALVTSRAEHPSVVRTAEALERRGVHVVLVDPQPTGRVSPESIESALKQLAGRACVSLQAVNHETGVLQPVAEVAALCSSRGVLLHSDIVQAAGRVPSSVWSGASAVSIASHKLQGPKGIGALATLPGLKLRGVLHGGSQERGIRPGTQDPIASAGFAAALGAADGSVAAYAALAPLRDELERALAERWGAEVNGSGARAPHVANLSFAGWPGPELVAALDLEGVCVSSGAACSAGTAEPSGVVRAMAGEARSRSAVRISIGPATSRDDIGEMIEAFGRVLERGPSRSREV